MGKTGRLGGLVIIVIGLALTAQVAQADYVVSVQDAGGASGMTANLGDAVTLYLDIDSGGASVHDSFAVDITFSEPGLM